MKNSKPPLKTKRKSKPASVDLTKADPRDLGIIGTVVTTALRNRGATEQEIEELVKKVEEVVKNRKRTASAFGISRKVFYRRTKRIAP